MNSDKIKRMLDACYLAKRNPGTASRTAGGRNTGIHSVYGCDS